VRIQYKGLDIEIPPHIEQYFESALNLQRYNAMRNNVLNKISEGIDKLYPQESDGKKDEENENSNNIYHIYKIFNIDIQEINDIGGEIYKFITEDEKFKAIFALGKLNKHLHRILEIKDSENG
jgi:hypothetical protein